MKEVFLLSAYNMGLFLLLPVWLPFLVWKVAKGSLKGGWRERLGFPPEAPKKGRPRVLVHAASCGEVNGARAVVRELKELFPQAWVGLSVLTGAGFKLAQKAALEADAILRPPLDILPSVALYLRRLRPQVLCLLETELWPNLLHLAKRMGASCLLLSARFQKAKRSRISRAVARLAMKALSEVVAQTERDRKTAEALGAKGGTKVGGNVKFDTALRPLSEREREGLKGELGLKEGGPILVAGSTHPGEEEAVAKALCSLREEFPALRAVVAPRRVERASEVEGIFRRKGFRVARRTQLPGLQPSASGLEVIVLDTMGELSKVYAVADVAFVGGSLVPVGGHSLIEPLAQGVPVLFGPNVWNFADVANEVEKEGAGFKVRESRELEGALRRLFLEEGLRGRMKEAALRIVGRNRGAARRCAEAILRHLVKEG